MRRIKKTIEYLFYLFIFLLPLQTRWIFLPRKLNGGFWEYGSLSIYGTEILLWLILLLYFFYLISTRREFSWKKINIKSAKFLILITVYLLLITSLLSIFWAADKPLAAFFVFRLIEAIALFLFIVNFKFSVLKFWWTAVASAAVQGALAFWQFATQSVFANKWLGLAGHFGWQLGDSVVETASGRWLRAYGLLPHPNMLAGFLIFGLIGILYLWLRVEKKYQRNWLLFGSFLIIIGLILSFSRGGWLAALTVMIIFWWQGIIDKDKRKLIFKLTLYYLIVTMVIVLIISQPFVTRLRGGERLEIKSTTQRLNQFEQAQQLAAHNWWRGVGAGNYTLAVHDKINPNLAVWDYQPVHNVPLLILVELGIVGVIVFMFLCFYVLMKAWRDKNYFGLAVVGALGIIMLFDHYLWTLYFGIILFWLGLGVGCKEIE